MLSEAAETAAPELIGATNRRHPVASWLAATNSLSVPVTLLGIVLASSLLRLAMALPIRAPWIFPDELVYTDLARSFATSAHFAIRGEPFSAWSFGPLYPIVIAPAYRLFSPTTAYAVVQALNCVLFSLAAVPAYFLGRRLLTRKWALVAAALTVGVPSAVYTSKIMTESLAYPLFLLAGLAIMRLIEATTWRREVVAIASIAIATLARGQLMVLFPALVLTLVLVELTEQRQGVGRARVLPLLRRYPITWATVIVGVAGGTLAAAIGTTAGIAGGHGEAFAGVDLGTLARSFAYHLAQLDLYLGVVPFAAFVLITAGAFRRQNNDRTLRALCALTGSVAVLLAAAAARYLVAVYAKSPDRYPRVYDRYEFYVVPLFLVLFLAWAQRGMPRPSSRRTWWIVAAAVGLPLILPLGHLLNGREWGTSSSAVALVPWGIIRSTTGTLLPVYAALAAVVVALGYVFARSTSASRLVAFVTMSFLVVNLFAQAGNSTVARHALRVGVGAQVDRSWIDARVGSRAQVAALWSGAANRGWRGWYTIWEAELFNASVRRVYDLREPMRYPLPSVKLKTRGNGLFLATGKPFIARYVLTDAKTPVAGRVLAENHATGMILVRVTRGGHVRLR